MEQWLNALYTRVWILHRGGAFHPLTISYFVLTNLCLYCKNKNSCFPGFLNIITVRHITNVAGFFFVH